MPRRLTILATALVAACTLTAPPPDNGSSAEVELTWKRVMKRVGEHYEIIDRELSKSPAGDLRAVAAAAEAAAPLLRHGYGRFRSARVKDFGRMARDTESWLLRIAAEAAQGRGAFAQELFRGGEERHCAKCHTASEAIAW